MVIHGVMISVRSKEMAASIKELAKNNAVLICDDPQCNCVAFRMICLDPDGQSLDSTTREISEDETSLNRILKRFNNNLKL